MKRNAIIRIVIFSISIFVLSAVLVAGIVEELYMANFDTFTSHTITTDSGKLSSPAYSVSPDGIRDLEIDWAAGSITIIPAEQADITVAETTESDKIDPMVIREAAGKLTIAYSEDDNRFIGIHETDISKQLVIYVPIGWQCDSLEVDAAAASLEVYNMTIDEVDFDGASGVCTFHNCQVGQLSVDTASGDVNFLGALNELDFDAMSACFYGTLTNVPTRIDMDTMSGDLNVQLPEDCGFRLNLDAMSSDFSSDFETRMEDDAYVCGNGACHINVSAMSGDVAIHKHSNISTNGHTHNDNCYEAESTCPDYENNHHSTSHH